MEKEMYTKLWLNYGFGAGQNVNASVLIEGFSKEHRVIRSAVKELEAGVKEKLEITLLKDAGVPKEGYSLEGSDGKVVIKASDENGALYGSFALIRSIACGRKAEDLKENAAPSNPLRMMNHWDNMDGSIERGYSGDSFFFADDDMIIDDRTRSYARLMASIGVNGVVINNVNVKGAATYLITDRFLDKLKELSDIFSDYGIRLYLSLNFASPIELGGLDVCDPLDEKVVDWWKGKIEEVYDRLPDFGGFLVKADSEGRPGPFTYGRTQADGANMLADIIKPYGGIIIWRCFVYNCTQD